MKFIIFLSIISYKLTSCLCKLNCYNCKKYSNKDILNKDFNKDENNENNNDEKNKNDKRDENLNQKPDKKDNKIIEEQEFYENILECLNKKKLFFTNDERNDPNFKKFIFLKNCDKNKNNRCWFIASVMSYLNIPVFQEIILNNNFDDNKYLKCLQKLCLEMRSKNNNNQYINFDELYNLIATDLNIIGEFFHPLDLSCFTFENLIYNKHYTSKTDQENYFFKENDVTVKDLEEIIKYNIFDYIIKKLNIDDKLNYNIDKQKIKNNIIEFTYSKEKFFLFFFEDKGCFERFLDLLNFEFETVKINKCYSVIKNYDEFIKKKQEIYNEIINSFDFSINSIIIFTGGNHFFSICKNPEDNRWYNFNSFSDHNGDVFEIDDNFKNNNLCKKENVYFFTVTKRNV